MPEDDLLIRIRDLLRQSDGLSQQMGTIRIEFDNARTANDLFDLFADIGDNYGEEDESSRLRRI